MTRLPSMFVLAGAAFLVLALVGALPMTTAVLSGAAFAAAGAEYLVPRAPSQPASTAPTDPWDKPYDQIAPTARANYLAGKITLAEFEGMVENALAGKSEVEPTISTAWGTMTAAERNMRVSQRRQREAVYTDSAVPAGYIETGRSLTAAQVSQLETQTVALAAQRRREVIEAMPSITPADMREWVGFVSDPGIGVEQAVGDAAVGVLHPNERILRRPS